ncbi:MAG: hypothetical protein HPY81_06145 [Firmicutes bacterium]|nr:hypothetical protein [Bacillota bacterium]
MPSRKIQRVVKYLHNGRGATCFSSVWLEINFSVALLFVGYRIITATNDLNPWLMALFTVQGFLGTLALPFMVLILSPSGSTIYNRKVKGTTCF